MPSNTTQERDAGPVEPAVRKWRPADGGTAAPAPGQASPHGGVPEIGGRKDGTDPTRFGDWEKHGRCIDF